VASPDSIRANILVNSAKILGLDLVYSHSISNSLAATRNGKLAVNVTGARRCGVE
jgi:O-succinylbenzoate synthase